MGTIPQQSNDSIDGFEIVILGAGKPCSSNQATIIQIVSNNEQGLSGIAFARFYLHTHPDSKLAIFEKGPEIGGTWGRCKS